MYGAGVEFAVCILLLLQMGLLRAVPVEPPRVEMPFCPAGSTVMRRPDGEARKCLPHQNNLCLNALDDRADARLVCCWHNQVDYFCCTNIAAHQCPVYNNVTVVIHHNHIETPHSVKNFHFKKGIEKEIPDFVLARAAATSA